MKRIKTIMATSLVLIMFSIMSLGSSGGENYVQSGGDSNAVEVAEATETEPLKMVCEFTTGNLTVMVNNYYWDSIPNDSLGLYDLRDGYEYLLVAAYAKNNGTEDEYFSTYNFQCYADNVLCDQELVLIEDMNTDITLSAGREGIIYAFFVVPKDASKIEVEYDTFLGDEIVMIAKTHEEVEASENN
ncbi:MAG: DUF4352 domain-containing protein [Clostridiales bacterium]|nr:DUF4352 domain-containing protein [Clostridiales bacterium]